MRKTLILSFLSLLIFGSVQAQITYVYDDAGNRYLRQVTLKSAEIEQDSALASQSVILDETISAELKDPALEEDFGEVQVKLYPNPTQGAIYFQINHIPEGEHPDIEIWSPSGSLLGKEKIKGNSTRINLWGRPGGNYIIRVVINNSPYTWKIIKE